MSNINSCCICVAWIVVQCLIVACTKSNLHTETVGSVTTPKLNRIRGWLNETQAVALPYKGSYQVNTDTIYRLDLSQGADTLFRKDIGRLGSLHLAGYLPDTINYYGVLLVGVIAIENWYLATFNKRGNLIAIQKLTEENCLIMAGDIITCEEFFVVKEDGTIEYHFMSIVEYDYGDLDSTNRVHEFGFASGTLLQDGKIMMNSIVKKDTTIIRANY